MMMWEPTVFDKTYLALLRTAAEDKSVELKKSIDCRTLRRTFGSLQLRAGKKEHEVAALMGDRVDTVRRHYARVLAEEVPIELAPLAAPTLAKPPGRPARVAPARGLARRTTRRSASAVDER
jgi:hypothetical protein